MQYVLIIGSPGSGKSVLAQRLAAATGLPAVHLDAHYWGAGWIEPTPEVWRERVVALMAPQGWIMDGNYTNTLALRLTKADTVVFLDFPRWFCLWRVLHRALRSLGRQRGDDMAPGCPERIDIPFLRYVWHFPSDQRVRVLRALQDFPGRVLVLRDRRSVATFVARVGAGMTRFGIVFVAACAAAVAAQAQQPGLVSPVSPACVSSPFGPRILPGKPLAGTYHYGIDLPAPAGGAVYAVAAGEVITLHRRGAGGLEVVLRHPGGFTTLYAHLGSVTPALAEGKRDVAASEKLGVVGRTGVSYGTHVYFELRVNGERVDPAPYLRVGRCK